METPDNVFAWFGVTRTTPFESYQIRLENADESGTLRWVTSETMPATDTPSHRLRPGQYVKRLVNTYGPPLWIWSEARNGCLAVATPTL